MRCFISLVNDNVDNNKKEILAYGSIVNGRSKNN